MCSMPAGPLSRDPKARDFPNSAARPRPRQVMTDFMLGAVRQLAATPHGPRSRVAVVQFSNDVRVEQVGRTPHRRPARLLWLAEGAAGPPAPRCSGLAGPGSFTWSRRGVVVPCQAKVEGHVGGRPRVPSLLAAWTGRGQECHYGDCC